MSTIYAITKAKLAELKEMEKQPKASAVMDTEYFTENGVGVGVIPVHGTLGSWWGTYYEDIRAAIADFENDPMIGKIVFDINSPGGYVNGCAETAQMIADCSKPTEARVSYMAASGAYWLASQCDKISATTKVASFGSIGVITDYWDETVHDEKNGYKHIVITSTDAPNKYIDPATEKGYKEILSELDHIHYVFAEAVAEGRGVDIDTVNEKYGKGGLLFADDALAAGMIDEIAINKEDAMTVTYTEEQLRSAIADARKEWKAEVMRHLEHVERAEKETVLAAIKNDTPYAEVVGKYFEEEYAAKELKAKIDANPVTVVNTPDQATYTEEELEAKEKEKREKAYAEDCARYLGLD